VSAIAVFCLFLFADSSSAAPLDDPRVTALFEPQGTGVTIRPVEGDPPAAKVTKNGRHIGYAFSTYAVSGSVGYSGRPIDIHVGLTLDGRIAGAYIAAHQEPILVIGITTEHLNTYVSGFAGLDIRKSASIKRSETDVSGAPDLIAGASVSSAVIRDAIVRSARVVARSRGIIGGSTGKHRLDRVSFAAHSWSELVAKGAISRRTITRGEAASELGDEVEQPDALFIDIHTALLTPPTIGQNILGRQTYEKLLGEMNADDQLILIAANGLYSVKGTSWRRTGVFDRIEVVQGNSTIRLSKENYHFAQSLAAKGVPEFREIAVFKIPAITGFDPLLPWRVNLLVAREIEGGGARVTTFAVDYRIADEFVISPATPEGAEGRKGGPEPAIWEDIWHERRFEIAILVAALIVLGGILFFQDMLVRRIRLYLWVRIAFLSFTLVFIGYYAGAQLSVVNVITFAHAFISGFKWELFLLNPLIFILWSFVAVAMMFWGRGVFCGWLCPFGALQELLNTAARRLKVPQIEVPWGLHERLWPIKYILFLGIVAASLQSLSWAFELAEIEPFKTAIIMKFVRPWPFGLYVLILLIAGLFIERFFCRYLCPLGAALAIPARLRMFEWLKRRHQCGRECRICATRCTVQAIHPLGSINPNECIHCMRCQATYYDDQTCLALKRRLTRRMAVKPGALPQAESSDAN